MPMFVVELTFDKDEKRRLELRPAHRRTLQALYERGLLVMSGPYADDTGALLIFNVDSRDELLRLLDEDPYTHNDIVTRTSIREWTPIFGLSG